MGLFPTWPTCALYMFFVPQPDITVQELAYICSHRGCEDKVCFELEQYATLPENIKRHFKQEK